MVRQDRLRTDFSERRVVGTMSEKIRPDVWVSLNNIIDIIEKEKQSLQEDLLEGPEFNSGVRTACNALTEALIDKYGLPEED